MFISLSRLGNGGPHGPLPTISSVSPSIWDTSGGAVVTIAGTNLATVTKAWLQNPSTGAQYQCAPVTGGASVTCVTPAAPLGTYDVWVKTGGGRKAKLASAFNSWDFAAAYGSNLVGLWDVYHVTGSPVSSVNDQSGAGNHMTPLTALHLPEIIADDGGGVPALDFPANNEVGVSIASLAQPATVFHVLRWTDSYGADTTAGDAGPQDGGYSNGLRVYRHLVNTNISAHGGSGLTVSVTDTRAYNEIAVCFSNLAGVLHANGSGATGTIGSNTIKGICLGQLANGNQKANMRWRFSALLKVALTEAQMVLPEAYIKAKWVTP
jgi:hypothetical protein